MCTLYICISDDISCCTGNRTLHWKSKQSVNFQLPTQNQCSVMNKRKEHEITFPRVNGCSTAVRFSKGWSECKCIQYWNITTLFHRLWKQCSIVCWNWKSIELQSKRQTPYFFCKALTDDASSSAWWRKSNSSFTTRGKKGSTAFINMVARVVEKGTPNSQTSKSLTFLLWGRHEHDSHVEAPHTC